MFLPAQFNVNQRSHKLTRNKLTLNSQRKEIKPRAHNIKMQHDFDQLMAY
jgi:hypothetical protein